MASNKKREREHQVVAMLSIGMSQREIAISIMANFAAYDHDDETPQPSVTKKVTEKAGLFMTNVT